MTNMTAADHLALLLALEAGLKDQIAQAKRRVLEAAAETRTRSYDTPVGQVNITRKDPPIEVTDEAALLAWVKENRPDEVEVIERVRPAYMKHLRENRWTVVKGQVIDTQTGEIVEFAALGDPGEPYITWPASKQQRAAKEEARLLFEQRAALLAPLFAEIEP